MNIKNIRFLLKAVFSRRPWYKLDAWVRFTQEYPGFLCRLTLSQTVNFVRIARRYPACVERFLDDLFVDLFPCFNNSLNLQDVIWWLLHSSPAILKLAFAKLFIVKCSEGCLKRLVDGNI